MSTPVHLATREWRPSGTAANGDARVALLVHGIVGWSRTWWRLGPALAERGWRVIAVDLRGHGDSPPIDGVTTATSLAADIEQTIEDLGVGPLDVMVAHSLGAAVGMELVYRRPQITRRLVLEDPPGQSRVDDVEFQEHLAHEVAMARADPESEVRRELAENPIWLEEDARQNVIGRARSDADAILASLRHGTGLRVLDLAPRLATPTLYLLADEARSVIGAGRAQLIGSLPPNADLVELDSGHTIHRDRFDEYLAALTTWLDR